jgi:nucleoside-diphosphate-sugar epimerase
MVMNAAQDAAVKAILQVSSAEIYGSAPDHAIDEDYPANPHSTYGASKLAIDMLVQARWREAHTPCIALRQFNCAGTRDFTHPYVIPEIIKQLKEGDTLKLGNNSSRDFQDAEDAVRMAVELLEKGKFGEVYNMGSGEAVKIYDLATTIGKLMKKDITIEVDPTRVRPWEIWHLQSSNKKLFETIEARPQFTLLDTLRKMINENPTL